MKLDFTYDIQVGERIIKVKELSFTDVKNLCKSLMFRSDLNELKDVFNKLISGVCVENGEQLNILEKIVVLLNLRGLTFGKDINISYNRHNITIQNDAILAAFNKPINVIEFMHGDAIIEFGLPHNFVINQNNIANTVYESIISIKSPIYDLNFNKLTEKEKETIINELPGLPFNEIYRLICAQYENYKFTVSIIDNTSLFLFDESFLIFFKYIFDANYQDVLDLEFALRRFLHFNIVDLDHTPFPECRIMFIKFDKESQQKKEPNVE